MLKKTLQILLVIIFLHAHQNIVGAACDSDSDMENKEQRLRLIIIRNKTDTPMTWQYKSGKYTTDYIQIAPQSSARRRMYVNPEGRVLIHNIESVECPIKIETIIIFPNFRFITVEPTDSLEPKMTLFSDDSYARKASCAPMLTD
jgi:hypothetical protein